MQQKTNYFFIALAFTCLSSLGQESVPYSLNENWRLQSSEKITASAEQISSADYRGTDNWYTTTVPTTVLAALVENNVFPDPYYGENLKRIPGYREGRWLVMPVDSPFRHSWWFRTIFRLPQSFRNKFLTLHVDGINYRANVWLNGKPLASADETVGMFRRFQWDITGRVVFDGENCLAIEIIPPGLLPDETYKTKQIEATTGWDDHNPQPPDANMGIWQSVYIRHTGPVKILNPFVLTDLSVPDMEKADLSVLATVTNCSQEPVSAVVSGQIGKVTFNKAVFLNAGDSQDVRFAADEFPQLRFENPRVWWPHPLGKQELYVLKLAVDTKGRLSDSVSTTFGIRKITSVINEEGWRLFYVNGRKTLVRGGAWMTSDMLLRLSKKRYDALIRYAREANLNMLRSEGFSIRETEDFFTLCDQYGIMVTQQIFGRSIPDEALAIACTKDTILRIRNHPSLVHFLGHDETFPTPTLDAAYRDLIAQYAPDRTYQPHSGAFDVAERFETGGTRTGTRELWTYAGPSHYYERKEDGAWGFAQSGGIGGVVAPFDSLRRFIPEDQRWPLWTDSLSFHTVIQGGSFFDVVVQMLNARYGESKSLEEFCRKAQTMNYECARGMFEAYGRNKYSATGITTWKYNAAWPAFMTWHYVDWYLNPTGAYYGAKKACAPLHTQYAYDDETVYLINNLHESFSNLHVTARIYAPDGKMLWEKESEVDSPEDSVVPVFPIERLADWPSVYFLELTLDQEHGKRIDDNTYWLSRTKDTRGEVKDDWRDFAVYPKSLADYRELAHLPAVKLNVESEFNNTGKETEIKVVLRNPSPHLVFQIRLAVKRGEDGQEITPIFWEDNLIQLSPYCERTILGRFYSEDADDSPPVLAVSGWNLE